MAKDRADSLEVPTHGPDGAELTQMQKDAIHKLMREAEVEKARASAMYKGPVGRMCTAGMNWVSMQPSEDRATTECCIDDDDTECVTTRHAFLFPLLPPGAATHSSGAGLRAGSSLTTPSLAWCAAAFAAGYASWAALQRQRAWRAKTTQPGTPRPRMRDAGQRAREGPARWYS
eukprot:scaffold58942_cov29-Prasinocladus_malaysianus.AAC.1